MLKNIRLGLLIAVTLSAMLTLVSCGGVGAAPLNNGTLSRVAVSVAPQTMTITTGTTETFTATVINTSEIGVAWLVNGFPGGVNPSDGSSSFGTIDKNGNYTAPPFIPIPPTVTVTAVANADNSASANASVSINGTPSPVSISPLAVNLEVGGIALFTGTVNGPDPTVTWLVENVPGGNAVVGTVSPVPGTTDQVNYIAPLAVPGGAQTAQVHVTAQSFANPQESASAVVTISALGGTVVTITSPSVPPTVPLRQTQAFAANVTGASDTTVAWEVDAIAGGNANVGTIATEAGGKAVFTAPARLPDPAQVIVTAISNAVPAAQASILVNLIPAQKVTVTISADPCTNTDAMLINTSTTFTPSVTGLTNQDLTWQVNQITGGNSTVGTITQAGVYTAPAKVPSPSTVIVSAIPVSDPEVIGKQSLTVTSTPMSKVTVTPTSATVQVGTGQNFTATVAGSGDSDISVTWNVNNQPGGDSTIGMIDPGTSNGCQSDTEYVAPDSVPTPPTVNITAVASDRNISNAASVTVIPPPPITEALMPGQQDPSTVQVQTSNNKVSYTVTQTKLVDGEPIIDTTDPINWTLTSSGQDCSISNGSICGTLTPGGINSSQQFTATYIAPENVPSNPIVTVTVTSAIDPSASDYNQITITNAPPTIAITGPQQVQAGTGPYTYTAVINNAAPDQLVWNLGCVSDSNSNNQEDFCGPRTSFGPGCIKDARGGEVCDEQTVTLVPFNVVYSPPGMVSTADYLQNACTITSGDQHKSIVPINVQMIANGCPLQDGVPTCVAIACVTVTPP
ncbi:MAG: hypothetical protein WB711_14930 [Terriglobales bacterium]